MSQSVGDVLQSPESSQSLTAATSQSNHQQSLTLATSESARHRRKIAALEEKIQVLESGHALKQRETNYYMSQGRAIRRLVTLYDNIEDLVAENDRRCDLEDDENMTLEQDRLQMGYITLNTALRWFQTKASDIEEYEEYCHMVKKLRQGADSPIPRSTPEEKHYHGFVDDTCGKMLCPTELDWNDPTVRAGIRDHTDGHVVTEMSWPAFLYHKYTADPNNLEEGLFKSALLLQAYKAVFTSPSSAKDITCEGEGANIIENNRRAQRVVYRTRKVKTHVAQIIGVHKVTPRSIAYISCQLRFALSSVTSWRSVDGDFDYIPFWHNIVDFFEKPPGRLAHEKVDRLLSWWTRKVFGTSRRTEISEGAKANMSVNALARQRLQLDDAMFDSE
ncbi:hypothetical protein EDD22DRAFT_961325 [Suillus occidentalis]|nr:hypothetical protein EDD22DRAFT_961325 [Suillus occidentalis]